MSVIFLDRFDTVSDLRGNNRTYENIKAAVLAAGKFSCFDVETEKDGRMFTDLCNDPEIETFDMGYPWTGVRRRTQDAPDVAKTAAQKGVLHKNRNYRNEEGGMEIPDIEHEINICALQAEGAKLSVILRADQSLTHAQVNGFLTRILAIEARITELQQELPPIATIGDAKLVRRFGTSL